MPQGTIKKIIADKGLRLHRNWRETISSSTATDASAHSKTFAKGDTVEFTEGQGPKGPCAENVKSA